MSFVRKLDYVQDGDSKELYINIPALREAKAANLVYGMVDCSGSMSSVWPYLVPLVNEIEFEKLVCFGSELHVCHSLLLPERCQGGRTNLFLALEHMQTWVSDCDEKQLTILFITDGGDNVNPSFKAQWPIQLKKFETHNKTINFVTVGIGNDFPASVSMNLRKYAHTGNQALQPLYWARLKADCKPVFESAYSALNGSQELKLPPSIAQVSLVPGGTSVNVGMAKQWFVVEDGEALLADLDVSLTQHMLTPQIVLTLAKQWLAATQNVALEAAQSSGAQGGNENKKMSEDVKQTLMTMASTSLERATKMWTSALETLTSISDAVSISEAKSDMDILPMKRITFNAKVVARLARKQLGPLQTAFQSIISKLRDFASGKQLDFTDRLALAAQLQGVRVGKHASKAMELRGKTDKEIYDIVKQFCDSLPELKAQAIKEYTAAFPDDDDQADSKKVNNANNKEEDGAAAVLSFESSNVSDDSSALTLTSNSDTLKETDLAASISALLGDDAKDVDTLGLFQTFAYTGRFVSLRVPDSAQINPWLVSIHALARHIPTLDTESIEQLRERQSGKETSVVKVNVGLNQVELGNAVIPLFNTKQATLLGCFLRTPFFRMMVSSKTVGLPGVLMWDIHEACLSALLIHTLGETFPEEKNNEENDDSKALEQELAAGDILGFLNAPALTDPCVSLVAKDSVPEHTQEILNAIEATGMMYSNAKSTGKFLEALNTANPLNALMMDRSMLTPEEGQGYKCEAMNKALFYIYVYREQFKQEQRLEILKAIVIEYIGRLVQTHGTSVTQYFDLDTETSCLPPFIVPESIAEVCAGEIDDVKRTLLSECYHREEVPAYIEQRLREWSYSKGCRITTTDKKTQQQEQQGEGQQGELIETKLTKSFLALAASPKTGPVTIADILRVGKVILQVNTFNIFQEALPSLITRAIVHGCQHTSSRDRCSNPVLSAEHAQAYISAHILSKMNSERIALVHTNMVSMAVTRYDELYKPFHIDWDGAILPLSEEEAKAVPGLLYNPLSGLCSNACMGRNGNGETCPWYLKVDKRFSSHLKPCQQSETYIPGFHKAVHYYKYEVCAGNSGNVATVTGCRLWLMEGHFKEFLHDGLTFNIERLKLVSDTLLETILNKA